jgi:1A family penicillin-binding protein
MAVCCTLLLSISTLGGWFKLIFRSRHPIGKVSKSSPRSKGASFQSKSISQKRFMAKFQQFLGIAAVAAVLGSIVLGAMAFYVSSTLPDVDTISTYIPSETTKIYSSDGVLLADLHQEENRIVIPIERISPILQKSVIAVEDSRFYKHHGVDFIGILRAIAVDIKSGGFVQGASTLTQQLARNLFLNKQKHLSRKLSEMMLAVQIERKYTKTEILEMYLNQVYWGHNSYGIESASQLYFGKSASELTLAESAMLVGLLKGPELYSPFKNFSGAKFRQQTALKRMVENRIITQEDADRAYAEPLQLLKRQKFKYRAPYFVTYVIQKLSDMYGEEVTYTSGMKVYTTLDYSMQEKAEEIALQYADMSKQPGIVGGEHVPNLNFDQLALLSIDPTNGYIRAMQGGVDYQKNQFNRTTQALRQPGSAFKPFVYLAALEKGFSPGTLVDDSQITFTSVKGGYTPRNYNNEYMGRIPLRRALELSLNVVAIKLNALVGPQNVVRVARTLGITTPIRPVLSLPLGANEVTMFDMTKAYGVLANHGHLVEPTSIMYIEDRDGNLIYESRVHDQKVFDENLIAALVDMMRGVLQYGTGQNARIGRPAAGKTGTTSDYKDAWFIGFVPQLVTATWCGNDNNTPMNKVTGGGVPALMWRDFMTFALRRMSSKDFAKPTGLVQRAVNWDSGKPNDYRPGGQVSVESYWKEMDTPQVDLKKTKGDKNTEFFPL